MSEKCEIKIEDIRDIINHLNKPDLAKLFLGYNETKMDKYTMQIIAEARFVHLMKDDPDEACEIKAAAEQKMSQKYKKNKNNINGG
jgi:hypothetical protein